MKISPTRTLLGLVSALVCTMPVIACVPASPVSGAPVTPQDVASQGTRTFKAERAKVFAAAEGALKVLGYSVAFSDPEAGILKTQPKQMTATSSGTAFGGNSWSVSNSTITVYAHAYSLKITEREGVTTVEATPKAFRDSVEVQDGSFKRSGGQGAMWDALFAEISSNLGGTPAVIPGMAPASARAAMANDSEALWGAWAGAHGDGACGQALDLLKNDSECSGAACAAPWLLAGAYQKHCKPDAETRISVHRLRKGFEERAAGRATACMEKIYEAARNPEVAASLAPICQSEGKTEAALRAAVTRAAKSPPPAAGQ